ncbi:MAG: hypothetical protein ACOYM3_34655, partial [Terrimicrobiaceae bacterium]
MHSCDARFGKYFLNSHFARCIFIKSDSGSWHGPGGHILALRFLLQREIMFDQSLDVLAVFFELLFHGR